ncbi:unnamed protein product, partial [Closterium sp. NIES-65]
EDVILLQHVARYGTKHWGSLQSSSTLPHRDQKACCNRFILLKRKFFQARAKGQNLQTIFPYINVNSQPQSPSATVASSMLHAPASLSSTEIALRVNASSRVISKRAGAPSLSKPAVLQSALTTVKDQAANGGGSVWMPNLVDAQRSPAVSDPSSPLSASHGVLSVQQQQQQLQQLLVTIGQSANAVSQATMQFVNATSSVNPTSFPASHVSHQQAQSAASNSGAGQQSAADAVVNMILRKLAGDASGFAKHPVASAAAASPASSKSDVSVEPASAAAPSAPLLDASSRPSSAPPRRPTFLSAPERGPSAVVPSSAGSVPADSGVSLQQLVPGSSEETESDDDMLLAYLYAQGHAHATAPEVHGKETRADGAVGEVEKQQEQQVQQVQRQGEVMAMDGAADMSLLLQLHDEVMALEKLVAAGASSAPAAAASPSTDLIAAPASALAPLPPRAVNASFSCAAAASVAAVPLPRSTSQRPDAFLEQMSSAPARMLFGFSPVYDLMAPGASWNAHAAAAGAAAIPAAGDAAGWDLKELIDVWAFNLGASAAFLA